MPFFYIASSSDSLLVSSNFWIYIAIAAPLTMLTIGYWRWKIGTKRRERRQRFGIGISRLGIELSPV